MFTPRRLKRLHLRARLQGNNSGIYRNAAEIYNALGGNQSDLRERRRARAPSEFAASSPREIHARAKIGLRRVHDVRPRDCSCRKRRAKMRLDEPRRARTLFSAGAIRTRTRLHGVDGLRDTCKSHARLQKISRQSRRRARRVFAAAAATH